jgi:hypothetical protein
MGRIRSFISRHRYLVSGVVLAGIGLAIFVLVWFQPQKLFIDDTVNEAVPAAVTDVVVDDAAAPVGSPTATPRSPTTTASPRAAATRLVSRTAFVSRGHHTSGTALLYALPDGSHVLRLENLETSNGPDLRVYLSPSAPQAPNDQLNDSALNLAHLKGNRGDQNYEIAAGVDVSPYKSVVIWCKRFSYAFGTASLG